MPNLAANITGTPTATAIAEHAALKTGVHGIGDASGVASLNASSKVVQDPANATATPTASKIPIADASGKLSSWTGVTLNAQTGTTYQLALTDAFNLVSLSNASPVAVTIPTNAVAAFAVGTEIDLIQGGAGKVTVGGGGVTINSKNSDKSLATQYSAASLIKIATDTWILVGDLIP